MGDISLFVSCERHKQIYHQTILIRTLEHAHRALTKHDTACVCTCKETLETTAHDAEIAIENHLHAGSKFSEKLTTLFRAFDSDGDGVLTPQEWESALEVPYIQHYLQVLDVRISDCHRIFGILDDGDGEITISEFCDGLKSVKGQARAVDMVVLQNATEKVMTECKAIRKALDSRQLCLQRKSVPAVSPVPFACFNRSSL